MPRKRLIQTLGYIVAVRRRSWSRVLTHWVALRLIDCTWFISVLLVSASETSISVLMLPAQVRLSWRHSEVWTRWSGRPGHEASGAGGEDHGGCRNEVQMVGFVFLKVNSVDEIEIWYEKFKQMQQQDKTLAKYWQLAKQTANKADTKYSLLCNGVHCIVCTSQDRELQIRWNSCVFLNR